MTLKGRDGYRDDQWLSPQAGRRASPEHSEKPCSPSTTELLPHPPEMFHFKQRGLWMFCGQTYLCVLHGFPQPLNSAVTKLDSFSHAPSCPMFWIFLFLSVWVELVPSLPEPACLAMLLLSPPQKCSKPANT